jgi:hypothetical protein
MPPFPEDQSSISELREMERKRAVRHPKRVGDRARRHALVAGLNEQAKKGETMFLGKCAKSFNC